MSTNAAATAGGGGWNTQQNPSLRGHDVVPCYLCPRMVRIDALLDHLQTFHNESFSPSSSVPSTSTSARYTPPLFSSPLPSNSDTSSQMQNLLTSLFCRYGGGGVQRRRQPPSFPAEQNGTLLDDTASTSQMQNLLTSLFGLGRDDVNGDGGGGVQRTRSSTEQDGTFHQEFHSNHGPLSMTLSIIRDHGRPQQPRDQSSAEGGNETITSGPSFLMQTLLQEIFGGGGSSYEDNMQLIERMGGSHRVGIQNADAVSSLVNLEERERLRAIGGACPICQCDWEAVLSRGNDSTSSSEAEEDDDDDEEYEETDGIEAAEAEAQQDDNDDGDDEERERRRRHRPSGEYHLRRACCGHVFCDACIQAWFRVSNKCPVCRVNLVEMSSSSSSSASADAPQ